MKNIFITLKKCPLFMGISENDMRSLLGCLNAKESSIKKGEGIFSAGDRPEYVGIVLSGSVHVVQEDYFGNRTILTAVQPGGLFCETFSAAEAAVLPVSVLAYSDCEILLIDCRRMLTTCSSSCAFHSRLTRNFMKVVASKNIALTQKIEHITKKSVRERVLSYLSECALAEGSNSFSIPFDRQGLADYLSVERSALSNTLSKMRDDGIIEFEKNRFVLL